MIHSTVSAPKGEKTKYRLAESMKECMKTTPVEEITVRQICEICGVTRQTFYRNFLDKYDLINWYFDKLLTKSFEHMGRGTTVFDSLEKKFTYIQKEKAFFAAAFRYDKQNSLREHDFDLILAFYENLIHEKSGSPVSPEMHFLLEMYCQGSITMTVKWVLTGMDLTPSEFATLLVRACVKVGLADCGNGFSDTLWLFFTNFVLLFLSQWRFFLKCYTSLLLSLSFSLPDLLI